MEIQMTPAIQALLRVAAARWPERDLDAEDVVVNALNERETLLGIVRKVAAMDDGEFYGQCPHCGAESGYMPVAHTDVCPVTRARALLGYVD